MSGVDTRTAVVRATEAVEHRRGDAVFAGYVSPSRNSEQLSAWRIELPPGAVGRRHSVDREEVVVVLDGRLRATVEGEDFDLGPGDALLAAPGVRFSLGNPSSQPTRAWTTALAGVTATYDDGSTDTPPWAR